MKKLERQVADCEAEIEETEAAIFHSRNSDGYAGGRFGYAAL